MSRLTELLHVIQWVYRYHCDGTELPLTLWLA